MKLRLPFSILIVFIAMNMIAQPLNWTESLYTPSLTSVIEKEMNESTDGYSSLKYTFTDNETPYFISDTFNVSASTAFNFSIDLLDNDAGGKVNVRVYFLQSDDTYIDRFATDYTVDGADWQTLSISETSFADAGKAYIVLRLVDDTAWDGDATFWVDNAVYSEGGENLIANGSFEEWVIPERSTLYNWTESLYTPSLTSTIIPETEMVTDGVVSVNYTFTDDETPYFISDTFAVNAETAFEFSVDILDNDPAGKVNVRVYFLQDDDTYIDRFATDYTVDGADWQTLTISETSYAASAKAYVVLRLVDDTGWAGSAQFYVDNAIYKEGAGENLILNGSFEHWKAPGNIPEFLSYSFASLDPEVVGIIDNTAYTVNLTVPYVADVTALVATFELTDGATVAINDVDQVSGTTANDFTSPVTYTLTAQDGITTQDWVVTVEKEPAETGNAILSFRFEDLDPPVNGVVNAGDFTVAAEVPNGTDLTTLVPTIVLSDKATSSPESGVATDFTDPVTYTVTAQDESTQDWVVTVTEAAEGTTILFSEDFEDLTLIPEDWVIINADGYTQAAGEERWQDSAWVVTTSSRIELTGTKVAMASSYTSDMPIDGKAYDWMILPAITIGDNTTLSWQAMSTTSSGNYPDDYLVLIAPAVSGIKPTVTYFEEEGNILLEVDPESWSANVGRPGEGLSSYAINLKETSTPSAADGWFDRDVWIAFVEDTDLYTNPDTNIPNGSPGGSNLAIDNILLVNQSGSAVQDLNGMGTAISVYPNPTDGDLRISISTDKYTVATIQVHDMLGKLVYQAERGVAAGNTVHDLNLSELNNGIYFLKTELDGRFEVTKLIVE